MKREIPKHCNDLDRIRALENENKRLEEENKKLKEELEKWKDTVKTQNEYNKFRIQENKMLKEKIKRLEFDVDAWYQLKLLLEWEIEKLKEYNWELIENHKKDMAILCEENTRLEGEVKELKEKLNKAWLEEYWFFNEY